MSPTTKSAKKALRKEIKRRKHNLFYKRKIKAQIRELKVLILKNKKEEAKKLLPQVYKVLDKAVKEKVIKKRAGARKKSRLAKLVEKAFKSGQ